MSFTFNGVTIPEQSGKVVFNGNSGIKSVYFNGVKVWEVIEEFPTDARNSNLTIKAGLTGNGVMVGNPTFITPVDFGAADDQWIWRNQIYYGWSAKSDPDFEQNTTTGFKIQGNVISSIGGSGSVTYNIADNAFSGEANIPFYRACEYFSQVIGSENYTGIYFTQANYGSYNLKIVGDGSVIKIKIGDILSASGVSFLGGKFTGSSAANYYVYNTNTSNGNRLYVRVTFSLETNASGQIRLNAKREFNTSTTTSGTPTNWSNAYTWSSNYIKMG